MAVPIATWLWVRHFRADGVQAGESEIEHLRPAVRQHQHVVRLQIAVHDRPRVRVRERVSHLRKEPRERAGRGPELERMRAQRDAVDQLHRDPAVRAAATARQQANDARMIELRHRRRLPIEAAHVVGHRRQRGRQHLHGHRSAIGQPRRPVHLPHPALPKPFMQREPFQLRKRHRLLRLRLRRSRRGRRNLRQVHVDLIRWRRQVVRIVRARNRVGIPHRRKLVPEEPIVGCPRANGPARLATVHFEPDPAVSAPDQRARDVRADVIARFTVGAALNRARRAQPLVGGERPRHRARV